MARVSNSEDSSNNDMSKHIESKSSSHSDPLIACIDDYGNNDDRLAVKKKSSFAEVAGAKIQLTWKHILITAPPKKGCCKKVPVDQEDKIILSKQIMGVVYIIWDVYKQFMHLLTCLWHAK